MPSTVIRSFHYDPDTARLSVIFRSGRRYIYHEVPAETFDAMKAAYSKGEFFNREIRDRFPYERADDIERWTAHRGG